MPDHPARANRARHTGSSGCILRASARLADTLGAVNQTHRHAGLIADKSCDLAQRHRLTAHQHNGALAFIQGRQRQTALHPHRTVARPHAIGHHQRVIIDAIGRRFGRGGAFQHGGGAILDLFIHLARQAACQTGEQEGGKGDAKKLILHTGYPVFG